MESRTLGKTGLSVSAIGFGGWAIGGGYVIAGQSIGYGKTDDLESIAALETALDQGVNLFDTADAYGMGHSECLIGQVLQARRSTALVATKVGNERRDPFPLRQNFDPGYIEMACQKSLRRLRRQAIDLYQLHHPPFELLRKDLLWDLMKRLKDEGHILHIGASINTPEDALECIQKKRVEFLQLRYTMLRPEWEREALPAAREANVGIIVREPFENGLLTGKFSKETRFPKDDHRHALYPPERLADLLPRVDRLKETARRLGMSLAEMALRYVLSDPAVACAIPGAKRPAQAVENCRPGQNPALPAAALDEIRAAAKG
jgi:aryl-alcohol dehydrogenase-like predicted oxidoreductase